MCVKSRPSSLGVVLVKLFPHGHRTLRPSFAAIAFIAVALIPAGSSATTEPSMICVGSDCVEVKLLSPALSLAGDDYGSQAALTAKIDGRKEVVHPVENGVVAVVCAPDCGASTDVARLRSRDWLEGVSVQVLAGDPGDPRSRARPVRFRGSFVADKDISCRNQACTQFDSTYVLNGRLEFPASSAPGLYDLWFEVRPTTGPQLAAGSKRGVNALQVRFADSPRFSLVRGSNQARPVGRIQASVLRRASKRHPITITYLALRRGPRGLGNPHTQCPPKGTDGGCIITGWDPDYHVQSRVRITRPASSANVPIPLPVAGRWRIDIGMITEHLGDQTASRRFSYVRR